MQPWTGIPADRHNDPKLRSDLIEINRFLYEVSSGIARLGNGEVPNSSGSSIVPVIAPQLNNYLYLLGKVAGQTLLQLSSETALTILGVNPSTVGASLLTVTGQAGFGFTVTPSPSAGNEVFNVTGGIKMSHNAGSVTIDPNSATVDFVSSSVFSFNNKVATTTTMQMAGGTPATGKYITAADNSGNFAWTTLPAIPGFANPTASVGLTAVNGSASTAMRSDAAPPLDVTISPAWTGHHTMTVASTATPALAISTGDTTVDKTLFSVLGVNGKGIDVEPYNSLDAIVNITGNLNIAQNAGSLTIAPSVGGTDFLSNQPLIFDEEVLLRPPAHTSAMDCTFTDSANAATGYNVWNLAPTISDATNGVAQVVGISVTPTITNALDNTMRGINVGLNVTADPTLSTGSTVAHGLNFLVVNNSAVAVSQFHGCNGAVQQNGAGTISSLRCFAASLTTNGTSRGTVTTASLFEGVAFSVAATTTYTNAYCFRGLNPSGSGTITTLYGLFLPNMTKGATSWAIMSQGGQSAHLGKFAFGTNTAPTAVVDATAPAITDVVIRAKAKASQTANLIEAQDSSGNVINQFWSNGGQSAARVNLTAQAADIAATNILGTAVTGMYMIHAVLEDTTADATAGILTVTFGWTDDVGATTDATLTQALTGTGRSRLAFPLYLASGNITYATTHTGIYGAAQYALRIRAEFLG